MDVSVAPLTVSTLSVWPSMMDFVIFSVATSPIPGVSRESSTVMRSMAPSLADTSTVNVPCLPIPSPMAVVAVPAEAPPAASALRFSCASSWDIGAQPARASVPPNAAMAPPAMNCLREQPDMMTSLGRTPERDGARYRPLFAKSGGSVSVERRR